MNKVVIISLLLFSGFWSASQEYSERQMIGFGCWFEGRKTKVVEQGMKCLEEGDYKTVRKFLFSKNAAKQFFGVIVTSKLDSAGIISLTSKELASIEKIIRSDKRVAFCSGCTLFTDAKLKEALSQDERHGFYKASSFWINRELFTYSYYRKAIEVLRGRSSYKLENSSYTSFKVSKQVVPFDVLGWFFSDEISKIIEGYSPKSDFDDLEYYDDYRLKKFSVSEDSENTIFFTELKNGLLLAEVFKNKNNSDYLDAVTFGEGDVYLFQFSNGSLIDVMEKKVSYN